MICNCAYKTTPYLVSQEASARKHSACLAFPPFADLVEITVISIHARSWATWGSAPMNLLILGLVDIACCQPMQITVRDGILCIAHAQWLKHLLLQDFVYALAC